MASDFHTHRVPAPEITALISGQNIIPGYFNSLQYHPWDLPEIFSPTEITGLDEFNALGEIGLDKLRGPELPVQQEYLRYLFGIAHDINKPVVLHVVKCYQELFEEIKPFKLKLMLHGFCGSPELLLELWKRNITVSFSSRILNKPELLAILPNAAGAFGFESDDVPAIDVRDIMERSGIKNIEAITDQNFRDFITV